MSRKILPALLAALLTTSAGAVWAAAAPSAQIAAAVANPARPAADTARDAGRKPAETVAFAGVRPGMKIAELSPGGGYYSRILSKAVGPTGKIYLVVAKAQTTRPGALERLNALVAELGNATLVTPEGYQAMALPEKVDLAWTTENYHDFHNGPTADIPGLNKAVFDSLKPGGVFYVEDHSAPEGVADATSKFHRMDEAVAKKELTAAGFRLDGESQILRNPDDKRAEGNADQDIRGKTDRFMLRMKRP